jgi:multidrug resistance efflux pump
VNVRPTGVVIVAVLLAVGASSCRPRPDAVAAEVPQLEIKAEVATPRTASVVAPYDGRVEAIRVAEGANVRAGDVIATIVNPTVARDLAYSRAQVALAEYRLRNARDPRRSTPEPTARDDDDRLRAAAEIVQTRKARLDRYEGLFKSRDITADDLENARLEHAAAVRDLAASESTVDAADPALLQLDLDKARAEADVIEDRERKLTVTAPMNGVITRVLATAGDAIFPRDPLFEVTDFSTLAVHGPIAPELVRHVRAGMPVDVKIFTVPPRRFSAAIASVVGGANGSAMLVVPVANPDGVLQGGMPATITVR